MMDADLNETPDEPPGPETEPEPQEDDPRRLTPATSRNMRHILPLIWRRRWLFALTFVLVCVYSASVQLRNFVPGVFFDDVLLPGLGGGESVLPQSFKNLLRPLGVRTDETARPMKLSGAFADLEFQTYHDYKEVRTRGRSRLEFELVDGEIGGIRTISDDRSWNLAGVTFSRLRVRCPPDAVVWVENENGEKRIGGFRSGTVQAENRREPTSEERWGLLPFLIIAGLAICVVIFASRFAFKLLEQYIVQHILADLRRDLIAHMCTLDIGFFNTRSRGDLLSRMSNDINKVNSTLQMIFGDLLMQPIVLLSGMVVCLYLCWWLALIVFVAFPFLFVLMTKAGRRVRRRSHRQSAKRGVMTTAVEQLFSGIRTVKSFHMEEAEQEHFEEKNRSVVHESLRTARAKIFANTTVEFFSHAGVIAVLGIGGYFLVGGTLGLSVGELVVFIAAVNSMYQPVKVLAKEYTSFQESMGAMDRVMEIFDNRPRVVDAPDARAMPLFTESIRYEHVHFSYGREPVLHDVDFEIRAGTLTAIVGPTGAGKSTLVDLLLRFYDPTDGRILIDGEDIRSFTVHSLLSQISMVSQDPFLFDTTIGNNIRYGKPDASQEEIEQAARMANIHDFITALPQGYETQIGDRGVMLSGGQRQRVTIARALLTSSPILVLDEATSNLDSESEAAVQDALEKLIRVRSTIAIAHRLSTIVKADTILVLDEGRIVERGTYGELMETGGMFHRLYSKQTGSSAPAPAAP